MVITSLEDLEKLLPLWKASQPLADYECFNVIVRMRKNIISPLVLVLLRNSEPTALLVGRIEATELAFRLGYATLAKIPIRQAVFVGGGFMGKQSLENWERLLLGLNDLIIHHRLDTVLLEHTKVLSNEHQLVAKVFGWRACPVHEESEHWLLQLPRNWDDFLRSRSKKHRYWLKRIATVLDRDFPNNWTIRRYTTAADLMGFAEAAEKVARKTYHRRMGVGFFNSQEYLCRMELEASRGQLQGYILSIGGEPKAFWYCFTYGDTLHLVATGYDPAYRNYELGTILLLKVFQDNCGTCIGVVDFGLGDAGYKQRFGSESFMEMSLYIFPSNMRGTVLCLFQNAVLFSGRISKRILKRLGVVQRFKTYWRRKFEHKANGSDAGRSRSAEGVSSENQSDKARKKSNVALNSVIESRK